jgi:hypothetical protein
MSISLAAPATHSSTHLIHGTPRHGHGRLLSGASRG